MADPTPEPSIGIDLGTTNSAVAALVDVGSRRVMPLTRGGV